MFPLLFEQENANWEVGCTLLGIHSSEMAALNISLEMAAPHISKGDFLRLALIFI